MIDKGKKNILGVLVNVIDYDAAVERIISAAKNKKNMSVSALAVHGVMTGVLDSFQRYRINHLDLVVPDGQPVRWALNWLYNARLTDRVRGSNLMLKVCEQAAQEGLPIYLYGSKPAVLKTLSLTLRARFPKLIIAGTQPSFFRKLTRVEKEAVAKKIINSNAAITFAGLGCPRQETWVYEYRNDLPMPILAVGAAFDFLSGLSPQSPGFLQQLGLEWCHRFFLNPGRLWKRYLILNPLYLFLLLLQIARLIHPDTRGSEPLGEELRFG